MKRNAHNLLRYVQFSSSLCVHKVVKPLNSFHPSKTWTSDDIERAHRVGPVRKNNTRSRTLVARLHRWSDKLLLLEEKENRKDMADKLDVREAADLTDRQQGELRRQKEKGKMAYYRNGPPVFQRKAPCSISSDPSPRGWQVVKIQ